MGGVLKNLPFNFTLSGRHATGPGSLLFGIEHLNAPDGFGRGELGFGIEFALRNVKLINGNRALGYQAARIIPSINYVVLSKESCIHFPNSLPSLDNMRGKAKLFLRIRKEW